ncbi:MAG: leucine-rich repeat domain-containing protein [Planctomycetaceae bacterium]
MTSPPVRCLTIVVLGWSLAGSLSGTALAQLIPDKHFEAAVREMVFEKKNNSAELTEDDLKKIYILKAPGKGIQDISGIEKCVNLLELNLAKNAIADASPLKQLKGIQSLDLSHNKIVDLTPLSQLVALQFLELSDNQIVSVEPLAKLERLSALYIAGNRISDPTPLSSLARLWSLDLARNQIGEIKGLANLGGLSLLKLSDNHIVDLSPLNRPLSVGTLLLERNKISDLTPLLAAVKADAAGEKRFAPFLRLYLAGNPVCGESAQKQIEAIKAAGVKVFAGEPEKTEKK